MTWAEEFAGLFLPGDNATKMSTDCRKSNKVTGSRLQSNSRLPAVLKKMCFPRGNIATRYKNLIVTATGISG